MSKYFITFLAMMLAFFGLYSVAADVSTASSVKNKQYQNYLTTATFDAAKEMRQSMTDSGAVTTEKDRSRVENTFYNSLAMDFGYTTDEDMARLHSYVPALVLIDTDGYYVCYDKMVEGSDGTEKIMSVTSPLNTWATNFTTQNGNQYLLRYYLGNTVEIIKPDGSSVKDTYSEVLKKIDDTNVTEKLENDYGFGKASTYESKRNSIIIPETENKIEYYINAHNDYAQQYNTTYVFSMPETADDDWIRVLTNPTCIAFLQGVRVSNKSDYLNIYSIGGGEIKKNTGIVYTANADGTKTLVRKNEASETPSGYVADAKSAAKNGETVEKGTGTGTGDPNTTSVQHSHWHAQGATLSIINGETLASIAGGCYTSPVYSTSTHTITYTPKKFASATDHKEADMVEGTTVTVPLNEGGPETSYTKPVYGIKLHTHTGSPLPPIYLANGNLQNPVTGKIYTTEAAYIKDNGCYTIPIRHSHTMSCLSTSAGQTVTVTQNIYHTHVFPKIHYTRYTNQNVDITQEEYEAMVNNGEDVSDIYPYYLEGLEDSCIFDKNTDKVEDFYVTETVPISDEKKITITRVKDNYTEWMIPKCGKTENTVERVEPVYETINGEKVPKTYTTSKKSQIICGYKDDQIIGFVTSCGYEDIKSPSEEVMTELQNGWITDDDVIDMATESTNGVQTGWSIPTAADVSESGVSYVSLANIWIKADDEAEQKINMQTYYSSNSITLSTRNGNVSANVIQIVPGKQTRTESGNSKLLGYKRSCGLNAGDSITQADENKLKDGNVED